MPKPLPSNSMPWPQNLIYDFHLSPSTSPESAEAFIAAIPTSDRNRQFLRLRYLENKSYNEIGAAYGITPSAVRMALKYLWEKASPSPIPSGDISAPIPSADAEGTQPPPPKKVIAEGSASADAEGNNTNTDAASVASQPPKKVVREELKPIITAIAATTRYRSFVYDSKARVVISSDNVSRELRNDSRYIALPDYYQIREYDLMQEFASTLADPPKSEILTVALSGLGPFKAFRSTVKQIGLNQAWVDFRYQKFAEIAEDWWEREVVSTLPRAAEDSGSGVLIVEPSDLNGAALIETVRVLYHRVGAENFEAALDELRDAVCSIATSSERQ